MSSTDIFQTRSAKLIVAAVVLLVLAAFQVAVQAKPAHAYEVHISITGAGTVDEDPTLTQSNILNPACSSSSTTPTGTVGANCYPGDPSGDYGWGWVVKWKATPAAGYSFVRWESDGSPNPVICDGATNGSSTYTGTSCQFATYSNLQTRAVFADTTNPAMASLTGGSSTPVNGPVTFNFSATSDPTFKHFECRVVGVHDWETCSSGKSENPASSGTYTFDVRAVDWSGNVSSISSATWTVDKTPPSNLQITSFPPSPTNSTSATFMFSSNDPNAVYLCKLDSGIFATCSGSNSQSYSNLSEGQHRFYLTARDTLGNMSGTEISRTWTIDRTAPETTLDPNVGPTGDTTTQANDPVFQFTSEVGATFECNLTGPGMTSTSFFACNATPNTQTTKTYTNLPDGTYTFSVRAKDGAGNVDASPASRSWTIRNVPTVLTNSLTPLKGATGVSRTTNVSATFSEAMYPDSLRDQFTNTSRTFKLQQWIPTTKRWKAVPATVSLSNSNQTATLDPFGTTEGAVEKALAARTKFKATITTGAQDAQGTPLAKNFVWTFTTGRR
jgi:Bacterial Ig-like domain